MGPRGTGAGPATTTGRPRPARLRPGARRTNLGLLILLVGALVTGGLAFAAGTGWGRPVVVAHGLAGLAVLVLAPWKSVIVRRGLSRRSGAGHWTSVAFGVLVLAAVAAGLAHATGALAHLGPVSAMQVHGGASRRSRSPDAPATWSPWAPQGMVATTPAACRRSTMAKVSPDP